MTFKNLVPFGRRPRPGGAAPNELGDVGQLAGPGIVAEGGVENAAFAVFQAEGHRVILACVLGTRGCQQSEFTRLAAHAVVEFVVGLQLRLQALGDGMFPVSDVHQKGLAPVMVTFVTMLRREDWSRLLKLDHIKS